MERVDAGDTAILEPQEETLVILPGVPQVLPDENEVRSERSDHFGTVPEDSHADSGAHLSISREGQLFELGLLHPDVIVSMQAFPSEVL